MAVEALSDFGWGRYVGLDGAYVTMHGFGASAYKLKARLVRKDTRERRRGNFTQRKSCHIVGMDATLLKSPGRCKVNAV